MIALLDAASNLGLRRPAPDREPGVRYAPWQLRNLGLPALLVARDAGAVVIPAYSGERDPETGVLHAPLIKRCGLDLAEALAPILEAGEIPLVLGGDCSVLAGALLALRRRGRYGLLYLDGHRDLLTPERSQHGAAAGMALALALGHGPESLVSLGGYRPLVDAHDVLLLGYRELDRWYVPLLLQMQHEAMQAADVATLRREGIESAFMARLDRLRANGIDGLWIHLDVDVLDPAEMPAVDCPEPGGLLAGELVQLLDLACASGMVAGLHVTIYDPERDADQRSGRTLVDILARGLARLRAPAPGAVAVPAASTQGKRNMATHTPAPIDQFRSELIERLLAFAPQSVLDVGCGDGALLAALAPRVARVAGVETDASCAQAARARGFEVQVADASQLPHADGAFDWVVLQYTAHHLAALAASVRECWRVARVGVLVQDPWYDECFVSQRIGLALDRWYKSIDRLEGMVHEDCLDAVTICGTLVDEPGIAIEVRHRLLLQAVPFAELVREVDRRLRSGHVPVSLETEARAILEDAERHGVSEPGMLMVSLRRSA